jgi:hypothetical protein
MIIVADQIFLRNRFIRKPSGARPRSQPLTGTPRGHSLLLVIIVTGLGWAALFLRLNPESKWGQVVGNIVSEWVRMGGLVFLTKRLGEIGSKE